MQNLTLPSRNQRKLSRLHLQDLSAEAKKRLKWFDWHRDHGQNVSLTCRHFGIARETFYRRKRRYDPFDLASLEDRSSRPQRVRQRTWTTAEVQSIQRLREAFSRWGKEKLAILPLRERLKLSASRVTKPGPQAPVEAPVRHPQAQELRGTGPWRHRPDRHDGRAARAGRRPQAIHHRRCRQPLVRAHHRQQRHRQARQPGPRLIARSPFVIKAIQVDGGSEFMAEFEAACQEKGILLFCLPPCSPKLNGRVERANRTFREEFYNCSDAIPTVAGFKADLLAWEHTYNHIRPHQALGYLTPAQLLANFNATHPQEDLSRTS